MPAAATHLTPCRDGNTVRVVGRSMLQYIGKTLSDIAGKVRVRSALNPVLWICAIVTVPGMFIVSQRKDVVPIWWVVILVPVSLFTIGFLFLLFFDRDKLQSEEYQIRKQSLELIQEKGKTFPVDAPSIEKIANPERSRIDDRSTGGS